MHVKSFPPVVDERARVLVLGSMPGAASLAKYEYYGNKRNHFWHVVYGLFGDGVPDDTYERRLQFAQDNRLALWDVIASCERAGSLDANIRGERPNDIPGLLLRYPGIRCLAFNGTKAYDTFVRAYGAHPAAASAVKLKLPSTSPIPTPRMRTTADRIEAWRAIVPYTRE